MEAKIRYCKFCGEKFVITNPTQGNRRYCSEKCLYESSRARWRRKGRNKYTPVQPHPITCKKCGKPFMGKWGAKYCVSCLETGAENGSRYFRQLLEQRTVNVV